MEMIFINSVHPELIRRSFHIVNMLAKEEKVDKTYLEIIWNNTRTSHEETVRATLELIQKLAANLNMKCLQFIFKQVKEIPNTEYNDLLIDFLRDYTFSAMSNYMTREREGSGNIFQDAYKWLQTKKTTSDNQKYFSIDKFWDIANDDLVTKKDIKLKALGCLVEILGSANCNIDSKIYFLNQSINKIISGDKYVENCRLFKSIAAKFNMTNQKESEAFHKISDSYGGFVALIIQKQEEIAYNQQNQEMFSKIESDFKNAELESEELKNFVSSYKEIFNESIDLIKFVIEGSNIELTNNDIEDLFRIYVARYKFPEHGQDILYTFFMKRKINGASFLNYNNRRFLFENILCSNSKINHSQITFKAFNCFCFLFLSINSEEGLLTYDKSCMMKLFCFDENENSNTIDTKSSRKGIGNAVLEVHSLAILGLDTIWRILCSSQYEKVLTQGEIFLASIYLKLNVEHFNDQLVYEIFFEKVFIMMSMESSCSSNCLHILSTFLEIFKAIKEHAISYHGKKRVKQENSKKNPYFTVISTFRRLDPSEILLSCSQYLNRVTSLLVYPEYETVEQAICLIKSLPILNHEKSAVFICALSVNSEECKENEKIKFSEVMGFTSEDFENVYLWLHFMKTYFKNIPEQEQIEFLKKFEKLDEFNISIILKYLKMIVNMNLSEVYKVPLFLDISISLMNFVAKLQQHYYDIELSSKKKTEEIKVEKTDSKPANSNDELISFAQTDDFTTTTEDTNANKDTQEKDLESVYETLLSIPSKPESKEQYNIEFYYDMVSLLLKAMNNLALNFAKEEKVKEHLVKTNFLEKSLIFISNRIERFPSLVNSCYNTEELKNLFIYLFFNGQRFRGHKILCNFIEHLCICLEIDELSNLGIKQPCHFFAHLLLTEMLEPLSKDSKNALTEVSQAFFAIIIKMYQIDMHWILSNDARIRNICIELGLNIDVIKAELLKGIKQNEKAPIFIDSCKKYLKIISNELIEREERLGDIFDYLSSTIDIESFLTNLFDMIINREVLSEEYTDYSLLGMIKIVEIIIIKYPNAILKEKRQQYIDFLLNECLFKIDNGVLSNQPRYTNLKLRKTTFELCLSMLSQKYINEEDIFINYAYNLLRSTKWRNNTRKSWYCNYNSSASLTASRNIKVTGGIGNNPKIVYTKGFVGLNNLSNTCYMNSIIQQLYMIPSFRALIMKADNPQGNNVLQQSKLLIASLIKLDRQAFSPKNFFGCLTDVSGEKFNPMEQRDADEFFVRYLDLLEEGLKGSKESRLVKSLFVGKFCNQLICIDCPHRSDKDEPFVTLSLQVKNKKNIQDSLNTLIDSEILQGENAYNCTFCENKKVNCVKRACIKQLPNILVVVLKRFELNYDTMTHSKFNGRFEFPNNINMREYTVEYIEKQSILKELEKVSIEDLDDRKREILQINYPDDYYEYSLKGIVIHSGEANSGHYYSYINDRESDDSKSWFEFNDSTVLPFDIDELDDKTYGGEAEIFFTDENGNQEQVRVEKNSNAYMLIYERKQMYLWETIQNGQEELIRVDKFCRIKEKVDPKQNNKEEVKGEEESSNLIDFGDKPEDDKTNIEIEIPPEISNLIQNINMKEWQLRFIFCGEIIDSISSFLLNVEIIRFLEYRLCANLNLQSDLRTQKDAITVLGKELVNNAEIIKFGIKYFLTVILRSSSCRSKLIVPLYNFIETAIENNIIIALYTAELFTYDHIITEFLMTVPLITFESVIAGLLTTAIKKIHEVEEPYIANYVDDFIKHKETSNEWIIHRLENKEWTIGSFKCHTNTTDHQESDFDEGEEEEEEEEEESEEVTEEMDDKEDLIKFDDKKSENVGIQNKNNKHPNIYSYIYNRKHDYQSVPIIIRIVNMIIHKTYEADSKHSRSHNLFNVLFKVAQLSPVMRIYFLENKMVGRLLDQFYGDLCKFKNIFSNKATIPLFKTNIQCSISEFEKNSVIQEYDNSINANENKEASVYTEIYYTFFYELVALLVCSCKFKSLKQKQNKEETKEGRSGTPTSSQFSPESNEISKTEELLPLSETEVSDECSLIMSPFFNHGDKPYQLSEEEEALLLLPTDLMFNKLFKTCNSYTGTSKALGKMYAHISWANKEFSQNYLNLLGQFIQECEYFELRKKFKIPLMQVLLLNDNETNIQLRAKIAMKHLFSQMFMSIKDRFYVMALEIVHLIVHLASKIKSIHSLIKKHKELLYPELISFVSKDPIITLNQIAWISSIPRNSLSLDMNRRLLTPAIEDMIRLNLMDKKAKIIDLFNSMNEPEYMNIEDTLLSLTYNCGDELYFFSDKYKDWIHSFVIQNISDGVIYIECELSSKEKNSPIFVFKEVLESLDKEIYGDTFQEIEATSYFYRLFKLVAYEA